MIKNGYNPNYLKIRGFLPNSDKKFDEAEGKDINKKFLDDISANPDDCRFYYKENELFYLNDSSLGERGYTDLAISVDVYRNDPYLVEVVQELGGDVAGYNCYLRQVALSNETYEMAVRYNQKLQREEIIEREKVDWNASWDQDFCQLFHLPSFKRRLVSNTGEFRFNLYAQYLYFKEVYDYSYEKELKLRKISYNCASQKDIYTEIKFNNEDDIKKLSDSCIGNQLMYEWVLYDCDPEREGLSITKEDSTDRILINIFNKLGKNALQWPQFDVVKEEVYCEPYYSRGHCVFSLEKFNQYY